MKPYDWSVVEPDITETVVRDEPHFRRLTFGLLLLLLGAGLLVWAVMR